ncbi:TetR/AcrR family transcriptional regulator [Actinomadura rudentiformis]|uniref:TetR/AcrR family transcriptional regulator n=1 Tax=Actinomadura rudentiformis TaxID=359158 RepID=A0A6H9Z314_9ACTN|nr:TetR/AcrR family transcriptional regulator [Actinomadura rudentiformis]KAB2352452.1 TetR/AcrR family transcriptional regulator [Actinomadura rudentiformis]
MPTASPGPRRRADAERNIARIVSAARKCLSGDPNASTDDIAKTAGVGRMTLYGHFRTRAELIEAALVDALNEGEKVLSAVDLGGNAQAALSRLLASSWSLTAESTALLTAAQGTLPPGRVLELHGAPAERVEALIRRGQDEGAFRTDLPMSWLVSVIHSVLVTAAEETRGDRLKADEAGRVVTATVQSLLTPP